MPKNFTSNYCMQDNVVAVYFRISFFNRSNVQYSKILNSFLWLCLEEYVERFQANIITQKYGVNTNEHMECQLLWLLLLSVQSLNQYLNDILYNSFQHTAKAMVFVAKGNHHHQLAHSAAFNRALPNALNCLYTLSMSHIYIYIYIYIYSWWVAAEFVLKFFFIVTSCFCR